MKSNEEIYHGMGFTDEMMIPKHLVMTLMHKAQEEQAKNLQQAHVMQSVCPNCKSESVSKHGKDNWCDDCGNVWRQTVA